MIVAAHQPNLLPWLGWLDKLARSDRFVLLDGVQLNRRSVTHRVRILVAGEARWWSLPVVHTGSQEVAIKDAVVRLDPSQARRLRESLRHAYGRAPGFARLGAPLLDALPGPGDVRLLELNLALLRPLLRAYGLPEARLVLQSSLDAAGAKSALMANLARAAGGTTYLSGGFPPGHPRSAGTAGDYNDPADFARLGLALRYQAYAPKPYTQPTAAFVPGLSAVDAFMWAPDEAEALLAARARPATATPADGIG